MRLPAATVGLPSPAPYRGWPTEVPVFAGGGAIENGAKVLDCVDALFNCVGGGAVETVDSLLEDWNDEPADMFTIALVMLLRVASDGLEDARCAAQPSTDETGRVNDDDDAVEGVKAAKLLRF